MSPLFGGEPAWHFAVVPTLFLAATRRELRAWTAGRLDGMMHWIRCGLVVLGCFAWTALVLWHRVAEVPDVGAPFVIAQTPAERAHAQERIRRLVEPAEEASRRYEESLFGREDRLNEARLDPDFSRWHQPDIDLGPAPSSILHSLSDRVIALGTPDVAADELRRTLIEAFMGGWSTRLRKELVDRPRAFPALEGRDFVQTWFGLDHAADLFSLNSILLLAEGKPSASLDDFGVALALERRCAWYGAFDGNHHPWFTNDAWLLEAAETMLRRNGGDPAFCRGLLALLNRHAEEMPSLSDAIKASYLDLAANSRSVHSQHWKAYAGPIAFLFDSPVETMRDDRLDRAFCLGLLNAAERKTLFLRPPTSGYDRNWEPQVRYFAAATPDCDADQWSRILSHQTHVWLIGDLFDQIHRRFPRLAASTARRNAIRLACAAALFRHDHGRDLTSLAELAPEYFPTLPESPYSECKFVFRRSSGETWLFVHHEEDLNGSTIDNGLGIHRTIAPGTGVIEMPCLPKLKVAVPTIR